MQVETKKSICGRSVRVKQSLYAVAASLVQRNMQSSSRYNDKSSRKPGVAVNGVLICSSFSTQHGRGQTTELVMSSVNRSRAKNLVWYGVIGSKEMVNRSYKNLDQRVQLECDGQRIPLPNLQGLVVLNILSYMGGINFWGGTKENDVSSLGFGGCEEACSVKHMLFVSLNRFWVRSVPCSVLTAHCLGQIKKCARMIVSCRTSSLRQWTTKSWRWWRCSEALSSVSLGSSTCSTTESPRCGCQRPKFMSASRLRPCGVISPCGVGRLQEPRILCTGPEREPLLSCCLGRVQHENVRPSEWLKLSSSRCYFSCHKNRAFFTCVCAFSVGV